MTIRPLELRNGAVPRNPQWDVVSDVLVYDRLVGSDMKGFVSTALAHHKTVVSMTPEALESLDQYITGANT
jgi:hypothetical protein